MKRIVLLTLLFILAVIGCAKKNDNSTESTESLIGESLVGDNASITEESFIEETISADSISEDRVAIDISDIDCADEEILNAIETECTISASEDIEYFGWVDEKHEVYRIALKRHTHVDTEYDHIKDYFFIKRDEVDTLIVDYPSKKDIGADRYVNECCDFEVHYEDVNFDGKKDIIIFLGYSSPASCWNYCAYLYENGTYRYEKTFEKIPCYEIDDEKKVISGRYVSGGETYYPKYEYRDGAFVEITEDCFEESTSN